MDYVSGKVTMLVGEASSRVNDTRRKWQQKRDNNTGSSSSSSSKRREQQSNAIATSAIDATNGTSQPMLLSSSQQQQRQQLQQYQSTKSPHATAAQAGIPFGGDYHTTYSYLSTPPPPPPIGFRTDLMLQQPAPSAPSAPNAPITHQSKEQGQQQPQPQQPSEVMHDNLNGSDESLYKGDAWARLWFQRVMILCLLRLLLFVRKVYEDFQATKVYNLTGQTGHFMIAASTLFLPTIVFTIYRVSRYLQVALPPLRSIKSGRQRQPYPVEKGGAAKLEEREGDDRPARRPDEDPEAAAAAAAAAAASEQVTNIASNTKKNKNNNRKNKKSSSGGGGDDDEAQLTRALMSSPDQQSTSQSIGASNQLVRSDDNDGLVTARQTPTPNLDEFHDSSSQQDLSAGGEPVAIRGAPSRQLEESPAPPPQSAASEQQQQQQQQLESVQVDKLLNASADRETTRVVAGASEQILHGALYIFWQLKRQVDVMGYLVERACLWRKPADQEKDELDRLRTGSDGLEWFQDFYAAFLAILAQVYTLGLHWSGGNDSSRRASSQLIGASLSSGSGPTGSGGGSGGELSISQSARTVGTLLSSQSIGGTALNSKDVLIMSELIVSIAVVASLLIAVRRRDDGILTLGLSMLGWGSLFAARIIIIALAFVHLGWHLMLPLVSVHVLGISIWIYAIALASHNDKPSERLDEAKWDEETAIEVATTSQFELDAINKQANGGHQAATTTTADDGQVLTSPIRTSKKQKLPGDEGEEVEEEDEEEGENEGTNETSQWSVMEHVVLVAQILTLFAIPSLFYWPIMFNLKRHFRPFKYLVLILIENFLLIPAIWFSISQAAATPGQLYLLGTVGGFSILGFIFISLYISCKPSLTEYFARADELFNEAEKSGIYYEFCSRVFKMPDLSKQTFRRLMNQSEAVEIIQDDNDDDDNDEE